jgi:hypothetical protein
MRDLRPHLRGAPVAAARLSGAGAALEPSPAAPAARAAGRAVDSGRVVGEPAGAPARPALTGG